MSKPERKATANLKRTVKQTVTTLRKLVRETRDTLSGIAKDAAKSGKTATEPGRQPVYAKIDEAVRVKLTERMNEALAVVCGKAADAGNEAAAEAIGDATVRYDSQYLKDYAERLTKGNESSIAAVYTTNISAGARRAMRAAAIDTFIAAAASGMTARERARLFMQTWEARTAEGAPEDVMGFVDRRGRRWRPDIYTQMLVRTTAQRVETASFCDSMLDGGFPLARISNDSHGNDCDVCARWSGKLIDLSSGHRFRSYAASLQEAREAGVFHPNCTHRLEFVPMSEYPDGALKLAKKGGLGEKGAFGQASGHKLAGIESDAERKRKIKAQQEAEAKRAAEEQARREVEAAKWEQILWGRDTDDDEAREMRMEHLERIREAVNSGEGTSPGGSTGAKLIVIDGRKYIVKRTRDGEAHGQLASEMAADEAYRAAGVNVPRFMRIVAEDGTVCKVSEFVEDAKRIRDWWKSASAKERSEMQKKLRATFDIDAMMGNWDVFGSEGDNVLVDAAGEPWRIDNGGSLSYRAQGAKKATSDWADGYPEELFRMPKEGINTPYIGTDMSSLHLIMQAGQRDWGPVLAKLSAEDRKVMEQRVEHTQKLAARADDCLNAGKYTEDYTDKVVRASYDLTKEGFVQEVPAKITPTDFGNCRGRGSAAAMKPLPPEPMKPATPDMDSLAKSAAITVNHHIKLGDFAFNQNTLDKLYASEDLLKAMAGDKKAKKADRDAANAYLGLIADLKAATVSHQAIPIFNPPPINFTQNALDKTVMADYTKKHKKWEADVRAINAYNSNLPKGSRSLTEHTIDYIGQQDWNDYVAMWTDSQAGNSWNEKACIRKFVEYNALGLNVDIKHPPAGIWNGVKINGDDGQQQNYIRSESKTSKKKIEHYTDIDAKLRAATMLMMENADFDGNERGARKVLLFRTEEQAAVAKGKKVGDIINYPTSPSESYSYHQTVYIGWDNSKKCAICIAAPYSRINCSYFMNRTVSGSDLFLGDGELEFNVNGIGIEKVVVETNGRHTTIDELKKKPAYQKVKSLI